MGWMELMLVGVVALIVVGPKDLPVMFQSLGKMSAKVKRMAREFQGAMNDAANATGMSELSKDLKGITSPKALGIDKLKEAADSFDKWEPGKTKPVAGSETAKLAAERAEQARKIREKTAEVAQARLDKEASEADAEAEVAAKPAPKAKAKPKPKATKPAAKPKAATKAKPAAGAKPAAKPKPAAKAKPTAKPASKAKPAAKPKPEKKTGE